MPRRLYISDIVPEIFADDMVRPEPYVTGGYDPSTVSPLTLGECSGPQPATVHRDFGAGWEEMFHTRWDMDANLSPGVKVRSAPCGRIPRPGANRTAYEAAGGVVPGDIPSAFYGGLLRPVVDIPPEGFMAEFFIPDPAGSNEASWAFMFLFNFDPIAGNGYGVDFAGNPGSGTPKDLYKINNWVIDPIPLNGLPGFGTTGWLRIISRPGYQGLFQIGATLNGAPSAGRGIVEVADTTWDPSNGGVYWWMADGRWSTTSMSQIHALYAFSDFKLYEAPGIARVRAHVVSGEELTLVSVGLNEASKVKVAHVGTGAEVNLPASLSTWRDTEYERAEVRAASDDMLYYLDELLGEKGILPGTLLTFDEETNLPPPTDPDTGEPTVPETPPPDPLPEDWRNLYDEFNTETHHVEDASIERRPDAISPDMLTAHTLGPFAVSDTAQGLMARVWEFRVDVEGKKIQYRVANEDGTAWEEYADLFTYVGSDPVEMDAAFDQNGRPVLAFERDGNVWIYYFHGIEGVFKFEDFGVGRNARILLDQPWSIPGSEVVVFYLDDTDGKMKYRLQSDRYVDEYVTPLQSTENVYLSDVVRTYGYRIQISYALYWPTLGHWSCGSFVTALYPIPMAPEGINLAYGMLAPFFTPVEFAILEDEGVEVEYDLAMVFVPPIFPELEDEGVDLAYGLEDATLIQSLVPELEPEGVDIAYDFGAEYTPVIIPDLEEEGVDIAYGIALEYIP